MEIIFQQSDEAVKSGINIPSKANSTDSGFDIFSPEDFLLNPKERTTINLQIRFALIQSQDIPLPGLGLEAQIRPKSGLSKKGIDVEIGTIDNGYRGWIGVTITNTTGQSIGIKKNTKICQLVFTPIFNNIYLSLGTVSEETERGTGGFGSSGL